MRAFTFFQEASQGVALQVRRIREDDLDDEEFITRRWFDWQVLTTHLWRMRKAALLLGRADTMKVSVGEVVARFDGSLPSLKTYRDVFEHMESYVLEDEGRHNKYVGSDGLQVGTFGDESFMWSIVGSAIYLKDVVLASSQLYKDIKAVRDRFVV